MKSVTFVIICLVQVFFLYGGAMENGPFEVSSITTTPASSCTASDATITITINPSLQGTSPYDISLDNGATWSLNNLTPNGAGEIVVSSQTWGTYTIAVRDDAGGVIYPGYAQVLGCTMDVGAFSNPTFSVAAVSGATGYTWSTTAGSITGGQNTTSATFNFSGEVHNTTGTICNQPTGPTCTAPPTCFDIVVIAIETDCSDGIDNDGDGFLDCSDCTDCTACLDSDGDGVTNACDLDDDNDGIPDIDECPSSSSGLTSPLMTFTTDISSADVTDPTTPHILNSITYDGVTYSDFIVPSSYTLGLSVTAPHGVAFNENDAIPFTLATNPNYEIDILPAFTSRDLGIYQSLDFNNFSDGDYYDLSYTNPILSNSGGFIAVTERLGNNPQFVEALDINGNTFGTMISVFPGDYVNQGVNIHSSSMTNSYLSLFPLDNLAPIGSMIYGLRVSFGPTATSDGPDAKVFIFGDGAVISCDADNDGISNQFDLDSDNDGIFDLDEAGHAALDTDNDGVIDGPPASFGANGLFNGVETSAESGVLNYSIADSEAVPDGVYDVYELDSDGDGCFDSQEASVADSEPDGTAGTGTPAVDANGLVTSITYSPPSNNNWKNFVYVSAECDTDNDFINPVVDLDDDNDGIPDLDECEYYLNLDFTGSTTRLNGTVISSNVSLSLNDELTFSNLGVLLDGTVVDGAITLDHVTSGLSYNPSTGYFRVTPYDASIDDYIEITLKLSETGTSVPVSLQGRFVLQDIDSEDGFDFTEIVSLRPIHVATLGANLQILAYENGGGPSGYINYGVNKAISGAPGDWLDEANGLESDVDYWVDFTLGGGTELELAYGVTGTLSQQSGGRSFSLQQSFILDRCDTDNDGIVNIYDLDSDNDGIFDVDEAGHAAADSNDDGIIDGLPSSFGVNGLFDAIETAADSDVINYAISDSENTPDGIYDAYELDSDGDTCFDSEEQSISDDDDDGLAGTGTPSVDLVAGLVTSISYVSPVTTHWRNSAISGCLKEICNDGIDNDGDGEIDCEDDDCPNAGPVIRVSN